MRFLPLWVFVRFLAISVEDPLRLLLRQVLAWLAFLIEGGTWLCEASDDPLDGPCPHGVYRARTIDDQLRERIAEASSSGGPSNAKMVESLQRWGIRKIHIAGKTALSFGGYRVTRYWQACMQLFKKALPVVLCLVMDATRVGKKDMLITAAYDPRRKKAMWLPPQVPVSVFRWHAEKRVTERGRHQNAENATAEHPKIETTWNHLACSPLSRICVTVVNSGSAPPVPQKTICQKHKTNQGQPKKLKPPGGNTCGRACAD